MGSNTELTQKLNEAVEIEGAEYVGTGHGFDVFKVNTFAAALSFVAYSTTKPAGAHFVQNENTFNEYIGEEANKHILLYFITVTNSNSVVAAVPYYTNRALHSVRIAPDASKQMSVELTMQYPFEVELYDSTTVLKPELNLPLYLLPECSDFALAFNSNKTTLYAFLPYFYEHDIYPSFNTSDFPELKKIDTACTCFGLPVEEMRIDSEQITNIYSHALSGVNAIKITGDTIPDTWNEAFIDEDNVDRAAQAFTSKVTFSSDLSPEDCERAAAAREQLRISPLKYKIISRSTVNTDNPDEYKSEAQYRRDRKAAIAAGEWDYEKDKQPHTTKNKEVMITGARGDFDTLVIPAYIEGYPVTVIDSYAFYNNFIRKIILPYDTLKEIRQGAFGGDCYAAMYFSNSSIYVPTKCNVSRLAYQPYNSWKDKELIYIINPANKSRYQFSENASQESIPMDTRSRNMVIAKMEELDRMSRMDAAMTN